MFAHIFTYRLKCLLRNKETIFWTLLFPMILATFMYLAISNVNSSEIFNPIDITVVDDDNYQKNEDFRKVLNQVSSGDDRLFNLTESTRDEAETLLRDNKIKGYIIAESPIRLVVNSSGLTQNIIKSFIEDYNQTLATVTTILTKNPRNHQELIQDLGNRQEYVKEVSATKAKPDNVLAYFYAMIAMSCFYGSFLGNREVIEIQANMSALASRVNIAPVHKLKTFIYSSMASLLIHYAEIILLLLYLNLVLKIDFGSKIGFVVLTSLVGSVAGLSYGSFISAVVKKSEGVKIGILIGTTMTLSFLAGMMVLNMKYIIAQNVPILSYLNPLNLLSDAFYSLYYYDSLSRYSLNMGILCIFIVLFCSGTYFIIRRRKYASL